MWLFLSETENCSSSLFIDLITRWNLIWFYPGKIFIEPNEKSGGQNLIRRIEP